MWHLAGITLIGLYARLYRIVGKELWYDEILDILQSQKSISDIFHDVTITPLHYLFVHVVTRFTDSVDLMRVPSVIFGVASILLLYVTVRKIAPVRVARLAAFLLAISPMHIEFSQQILHYSFFVFFTILTLYFYLDLLIPQKRKPFSILGFFIASALNVLTHMSSVLVICIEFGVLASVLLIKHRKVLLRLRSGTLLRKRILLVLFLVGLSLAFLLRLDYLSPYLFYSSFDLSRPIPLGFSLAGQLQTKLLFNYSLPFFKAMLIWFGFGKGVGYLIPFAFALGGLVALRRRPTVLFLVVSWLTGPFVILYVTRMSHWFEEKYFIFILPIYLYVIAEGVAALLKSATSDKANSMRQRWFVAICYFGFLILAVQPIQSRTTYGYRVAGDPGYAWTKAISYVQEQGERADITFIDDIYGQIYLGSSNKNKSWYSEQSIIQFDTHEYESLVNSKNTHFYASIPDIQDMRIGSIVDPSPKKVVGGINVYTVKFLREQPLLQDEPYIDNFMRMNYLKSATSWDNVLLTFDTVINSPYPQTELDNLLYLVPSRPDHSYVQYDFNVQNKTQPTYFRINYVAPSPDALRITFDDEVVKPMSQTQIGTYRDITYDVSQFVHDGKVRIHLGFKYPYTELKKTLIVGIKSIGLSHAPHIAPSFTKEQEIYRYDAGLTGTKSTKWWTESSRSFGWVQTKHGDLYRRFGTRNDFLEYVFTIPPEVRGGHMILRTFTARNKITLEASTDGENYSVLASHSKKLSDFEEQIVLDPLIRAGSKLYLRFRTDTSNQDASIRSFSIQLR